MEREARCASEESCEKQKPKADAIQHESNHCHDRATHEEHLQRHGKPVRQQDSASIRNRYARQRPLHFVEGRVTRSAASSKGLASPLKRNQSQTTNRPTSPPAVSRSTSPIPGPRLGTRIWCSSSVMA